MFAGAVSARRHLLPVIVVGLCPFALLEADGQSISLGSTNALAGAVPRVWVERRVQLTDAPGRLHQRVSTTSLEAQAFYDQGIAYMVSYDWVEAARAFHQAIRLDPALAMGYLGLSKAYFQFEAYAEARQYQQKASDLAASGKVSAKEAKWIALSAQQREMLSMPAKDRATAHAAYQSAVDELIALDPDDAHAWVLRGNAEETGRMSGQDGRIATIAFYESALHRDPTHIGAHHFLIHSYENLGLNVSAAEHARRYAEAARGAPHAQHMFGHVLPALGLWSQALVQFGEADRLHRERATREQIHPGDDWHFKHNARLLAMTHLRLGQTADAERLLKEVAELEPRTFFSPYYQTAWAEYLLAQGRFQEALIETGRLEQGTRALTRLLGGILAGEALLGLRRVEDAKQARRRAEDSGSALVAEAKRAGDPGIGQSVDGLVRDELELLQAMILMHTDRPQDGEQMLLKIVDSLSGEHHVDSLMYQSVFFLKRMASAAERAGRGELAKLLVDRLNKLNRVFEGHGAAAAHVP